MRDYDGFISDWVEARVLPDTLSDFIKFVKRNVDAKTPIVELGCGNGIVASALGCEGYDVTAVDIRFPPVTEPFNFLKADGNSDEFFSLLVPGVVLIGRRSLCLFHGAEWTERLNASPVSKLVIESLNGEKHRFRTSQIEAEYLKRNGWDVEVTGMYILATRPSLLSSKRSKKEVQQPLPE